jgi:hypothetical protein
MAHQSLIIIDNFYDNPHEIREQALSLSYKEKPDATYPGKEAFVNDYDWSSTRNRLSRYIDEDVSKQGPKNPPFIQGKFRLALAEDQIKRPDLVHEDVQKWSAVIYLSLPEHCQGGIGLYKHKESGYLASTDYWFQNTFQESLKKSPHILKEDVRNHFKNQNNWEKIGELPMLFNRAIILMAHCFHGSTGVFGTKAENGRLTQHFEFYS